MAYGGDGDDGDDNPKRRRKKMMNLLKNLRSGTGDGDDD